ncbi:HET-domain-containing protein, partial [Eremomyces bilateralis CBS 781.70]
MSEYRYSQLSLPTSIRLLRLLPSEKDAKSLRCELFDYRLRNSNKPSHPYEALSYVWGSEDKPQTIIIDNQSLDVTQNLYTALLHLRDHGCSRIIWIDAICIDQANDKEKEDQIPLMAEIYAKAHRVVVWLGEAENDSDRALEAIRLTGETTARISNTELDQTAFLQLLQRPWFRRIWVLQEMAAARHILIICGSIEIDGHAFCSGLDVLGAGFKFSTSQVAFLIRGAIFRSRNMSRKQGILSLDICSLGELIDMYHSHQATKRHDKVYALLGMCSDDLSTAGLEPDYSLPWRVLMQRVVKFLLSDHVSVDTWNEKETAVIKSKGCVLGKVATVGINNVSGGRQNVKAIIKTSPGCGISGSASWLLQTSAKSIQNGDLICLLRGALMPTIVRLRGDHFTVVVIAAVPPKHIHAKNNDVEWSELAQSASFIRDFLLIWDWETS